MADSTVNIVVGLAKPPYVIKEDISGFEIELVEQLYKSIGKKTKFIFSPYTGFKKMLSLQHIDAIMTANQQLFPDNKTLNDVYIKYQNIAVTLKKNNIALSQISDLSNYTIASFQNAHKVLGEEFAKASSNSPLFMQVYDQEKQIKLLLLNRIDVLVIDVHIFQYYLHKVFGDVKDSDIQYHYVFPASPYKLAFKNPTNMVEFNQALANYKLSDDYQKLLKKYNF